MEVNVVELKLAFRTPGAHFQITVRTLLFYIFRTRIQALSYMDIIVALSCPALLVHI